MFLQKDSDDLLDYVELLSYMNQDSRNFDLDIMSQWIESSMNEDDKLNELISQKKVEYFNRYLVENKEVLKQK